VLDTDLKIILLDHHNNFFREPERDDNAAISFKVPATSLRHLSVLHNYNILVVQTELFSDLYLVELLDISVKPFPLHQPQQLKIKVFHLILKSFNL